jgi:hypothetical protein
MIDAVGAGVSAARSDPAEACGVVVRCETVRR